MIHLDTLSDNELDLLCKKFKIPLQYNDSINKQIYIKNHLKNRKTKRKKIP